MWDYAEASRIVTLDSVTSNTCLFCRRDLFRTPAAKFVAGKKALLAQVAICPACGWWSVYRVHQGEYEQTAGIADSYSGTVGSLKEFDLTDISAPLAEVRQYLLARQDSIFAVHPRLFENVVASVFGDFGWQVRVTAYCGDDGIDMVLDGAANATVGVQVKRYSRDRRIEAEQIRSFAGALLLNGQTRGIFVSTSAFRSGALNAAIRYAAIGYPIELIDAERFLDALEIAQVRSFKLTAEKMGDCIAHIGLHLGTGLNQEFCPGEDLRARSIAVQAFTKNEMVRIHANGSPVQDEGVIG